jgi:enoyl-CoA hydratase
MTTDERELSWHLGDVDGAAISVEIANGVAVVTISNPTSRNALTPELSDMLAEALDRIDINRDVGALVVRGANGTFCTGADLSVLAKVALDPASEQSYEAIDRVYRAFTRIGTMNVLTVAAMRGWVVGAGMNLALSMDVRIVADDAHLRSGFFRLGLHPGGGHLRLLISASSPQVAAAMTLLSQDITGLEASRLGLAWEALPDELVEERAVSLAAVAGRDPELARKVVESLRLSATSALSWQAALQAERAPQLWSLRRAGVNGASLSGRSG